MRTLPAMIKKAPKKLTKTQAKAKRFMAKIVGDSADKILHKTKREIGPVNIIANKVGYNITLTADVPGKSSPVKFTAQGKSLSAALRTALKAWQAVQ